MENKELSAQFFLSNLSHSIRTPLNGIVGYTQLLLQTKLDKNQQMYINSTNHCCMQLVELVNDILDFSKLTTGKAQVNNECFSFNEIIEEVNSAIGYRIKEKKQKCRYEIDKDLPEYVISDKQKLIQIMINLISNANKFTPIGGRIIVYIQASNSNTFECAVEDDGIGISLEDQKKLFNPFVQVQESLTKHGSGLGLAICKKLVELLGGTISVESDTGQGAVFTFSIKYEPYEEFKKLLEQNCENLKNKFVLIVDDNVDSRLLLGEILFEYKTRPIICSSGKEALRMVSGKRYPFSIALIDIYMPDIPGSELAKQLKDVDQEMPLIAMSSLDEPFNSEHFTHILHKPVNKVKLLDLLSKAVNKDDISQYQINTIEEKNDLKKEIKFLIAEDVSYNSAMLVEMLNNMGYKNVDVASDGEEAIRKIDENKTKPYDLLLLDLKMPKIDGLGVAEYIKSKNYSYPKIAVITASVLETDKDKCRDLGIKYFLLKPFNMTHLRTVITKVLN